MARRIRSADAAHVQSTIDPADWDTIRFDVTNEIEVPAQFWADDEAPILVSVRRKSSRALPSEADPVKIGLKIDINELVSDQQWHGLVKLSLENAGDIAALHEGMAWQLHQLAANTGFYGPEAYPALANWVRVNINGAHIGVYTNVEQRDTQFLRNRGVRVSGKTWLYEIDDIDQWVLESGDPHSPTFLALCYQPFAPAPKGKVPAVCTTPNDVALETTLDSVIEMNAMLAQGAVDAFTDNPDALFSHGKNFFFADFDHSGLRRRYYPWDLDAVFRTTSGGIYGRVAPRGDRPDALSGGPAQSRGIPLALQLDFLGARRRGRTAVGGEPARLSRCSSARLGAGTRSGSVRDGRPGGYLSGAQDLDFGAHSKRPDPDPDNGPPSPR